MERTFALPSCLTIVLFCQWVVNYFCTNAQLATQLADWYLSSFHTDIFRMQQGLSFVEDCMVAIVGSVLLYFLLRVHDLDSFILGVHAGTFDCSRIMSFLETSVSIWRFHSLVARLWWRHSFRPLRPHRHDWLQQNLSLQRNVGSNRKLWIHSWAIHLSRFAPILPLDRHRISAWWGLQDDLNHMNVQVSHPSEVLP